MYPQKQEKVYRGVQSHITYTVCCENERVNFEKRTPIIKEIYILGYITTTF